MTRFRVRVLDVRRVVEEQGSVVPLSAEGQQPLLEAMRMGERRVVVVPTQDAVRLLPSSDSGPTSPSSLSLVSSPSSLVPALATATTATAAELAIALRRVPLVPPVLPGRGCSATESSGAGGAERADEQRRMPESAWTAARDGNVTELLRLERELLVSATHPEHGASVLHVLMGGRWAAEAGDDEARAIVSALVEERGCDVNARAGNGSTPLHWAAGAGSVSAVRALLHHKADPSIPTYTWRRQVFGKGSGQLPMHWAAESGHASVVALLLEASGGLLCAAAPDERGVTPAQLARTEGFVCLADSLHSAAETRLVALEITKIDARAALVRC